MKNVALIADSHFDETNRFDECIRIHDWIADDLAKRGVDLILHAGDVFERKSTAKERIAVANWLTKLAEIAPVLIVRGNHDAISDLSIFSRLDTKHPIAVEELAGLHRIAGFEVAAVAWPRKAELLAAIGTPVSAEEAGQVAQRELQNLLRGLGQQFTRHSSEPKSARLLLMHAMVSGSVTSTGQPLVGCDMELSLDDLELCNADAYLLGHIHKGQQWTVGNDREFVSSAPVIYPGSPRRTAFGEVEDKAYYVLSFLDGSLRRTEKIETPATPMILDEAIWADGHWTNISKPQWYQGAEVRFRYTVESDQRDAGKDAAAQVAKDIMGDGAISVKIEEVVTATTRARTPEITTATSLPEKLEVLWNAKGQVPEQARKDALFAKLANIEQEVGTVTADRSHSSRFNSIRVSDIGPFGNDAFVDFDSLPGTLVAITGENGAGKSTLLELLPGALYRDTPTRGRLKDLATSRNAFVEVGFTNGNRYNIRQTVDSISDKGESLVTDALGNAVTVTGKVKEFDTWAASHLPSPEILYSSVFAAQGSGGFLEMKAGDRKAVLLRMLGCERLEGLAAAARTKQLITRQGVAVLNARVEETRKQGGDVEECEAQLSDARRAEQLAEIALSEAQSALMDARLEAQTTGEDLSKLKAYREKLQDLNERLVQAEAERVGVTAKVTKCQEILDRRVEIENAAEEAAELDREKERASLDLSTATVAVSKIRVEIDGLEREIKGYEQRERQLRNDIVVADQRLLRKGAVDAAVESLSELRATFKDKEVLCRDLQAEREEFNSQQLMGAEDRIQDLRCSLVEIRDEQNPNGPVWLAGEAIKADDRVVKETEERPALLVALEARISNAVSAMWTAEEAVKAAERIASEAPMLGMVASQKEAANLELESVTANILNGKARLTPLREECERLVTVESNLRAQVSQNKVQLDRLKAPLALLEPLRAAQTRISELLPQLDGLDKTVLELETKIEDMGPEPEQATAVDLPRFEERVKWCDSELKTAQRAVASKEQALNIARGTAERLAEINIELKMVSADLADWTRLSDDLGRDGLQALEIDAAGPELTELINDLLRSCVGSRFTVSVETTRLSADGKKQLEGCDVKVLDTLRGRDANAETLSGGERVIVGEAIALALSMLACRRSGVQGPTLVRDETAGALSAVNGRAYIAMLRRASEIIGASKVLYVSHDVAMQELADSRIHIANGQVSVNQVAA